MKNDCNNCERRFKEESRAGCQAFKEKPRNCWAWTSDKNWLEKVNEAVRHYQMVGRAAYQRYYRKRG